MNRAEEAERILEFVADVLAGGGLCELPGMGVFAHTYKLAKEKEEKLFPGERNITFRADGRVEEYPFLLKISEYFRISQEEAKEKWAKAAEEIKDQIQKYGRITLPGIGWLKGPEIDKLRFEPKEQIRLYEPLPLHTGIEDGPEDLEKSKSRTWLYLVLVLLLGLGVAFYFYQRSTVSPASDSAEEGAAADRTLTGEGNTPTVDSVEPEPIENPLSDSVYFVIVFRDFKTQDDAARYFRKMKGWGHDIQILRADSSLFLAGYPYYSLLTDTTEKLGEIRDIYGVETKVILPKEGGIDVLLPEQDESGE